MSIAGRSQRSTFGGNEGFEEGESLVANVAGVVAKLCLGEVVKSLANGVKNEGREVVARK